MKQTRQKLDYCDGGSPNQQYSKTIAEVFDFDGLITNIDMIVDKLLDNHLICFNSSGCINNFCVYFMDDTLYLAITSG